MRQLITMTELDPFIRAASATGAGVQGLAGEGESYEHTDPRGEVHRNIVPDDHCYVEITDADGGEELTGFWRAVHGQEVPV